jgi:hypothetical protein
MTTVFGRWVLPVVLAGWGVSGCKKEEAPAPPAVAEAPVREAPTPPPAAEADAGSAEDAGAPQAAAPTPAEPAAPPATATPPENPKNREWTAGIVDLRRPGLAPVTLRSVRAGRHADFDRVVFEFDGPQVPGYHLEYIDTPVRKCGSGDTTAVAGQGWLQVRLQPAQAHANGQVTVAEREQKPALPLVQELELTCDFEGEVTWVLGNKAPNTYRVLELREPTRLVVDVRH